MQAQAETYFLSIPRSLKRNQIIFYAVSIQIPQGQTFLIPLEWGPPNAALRS